MKIKLETLPSDDKLVEEFKRWVGFQKILFELLCKKYLKLPKNNES